ncbi:MAG: hypothetical protein FVQ81_10430 [Candidatus Glassbacteria bacterium]|nr:hypothetical protein [Candidatus Glassbacteria bacterium]
MDGTTLLHRLIAYDRWANAQTHQSLAPVTGKAPKAVTLLAHIHMGWDVWMDRIGKTEGEIDLFPELSLDECGEIGQRAQERWDQFLAELEDNWSDRVYRAKLLDGSEANFALCEIVMQLVTHGSHHRGQINTLVRRAGGKPLNTTFMRYVVTKRD